MREIDFRAWDRLEMRMIQDFINHSCWVAKDNFNAWRLNRYIPMEWTGKKDINGRKIYEGDYVIETYYLGDDDEVDSKVLCKVVFKDGAFIHSRIIGKPPYNSYRQAVKVFGNIHENPDLLQLSVIYEEEE